MLADLEGESGELTGYTAGGTGLFYDHPATWTQSGKTITLRMSYAGGETLRLMCTSVR